VIAYVSIQAVCELCSGTFTEQMRVEISSAGRIEPDLVDKFVRGVAVVEHCGHAEYSYYCNDCWAKRKAGAK